MSATFRQVEAHTNGDCGSFCPCCDWEELQEVEDES